MPIIIRIVSSGYKLYPDKFIFDNVYLRVRTGQYRGTGLNGCVQRRCARVCSIKRFIATDNRFTLKLLFESDRAINYGKSIGAGHGNRDNSSKLTTIPSCARAQQLSSEVRSLRAGSYDSIVQRGRINLIKRAEESESLSRSRDYAPSSAIIPPVTSFRGRLRRDCKDGMRTAA